MEVIWLFDIIDKAVWDERFLKQYTESKYFVPLGRSCAPGNETETKSHGCAKRPANVRDRRQ